MPFYSAGESGPFCRENVIFVVCRRHANANAARVSRSERDRLSDLFEKLFAAGRLAPDEAAQRFHEIGSFHAPASLAANLCSPFPRSSLFDEHPPPRASPPLT